MNRMYTPTPDAYCGDEDNGQTSAWYVFTSLGFYPVCPGTNQYILGAPLFKKAKLHFENGNVMEIDAPNNSDENFYLNKYVINAQESTRNYIEYETLLKGGRIECDMTAQPNKNRGVNEADFPYSFSREVSKKK